MRPFSLSEHLTDMVMEQASRVVAIAEDADLLVVIAYPDGRRSFCGRGNLLKEFMGEAGEGGVRFGIGDEEAFFASAVDTRLSMGCEESGMESSERKMGSLGFQKQPSLQSIGCSPSDGNVLSCRKRKHVQASSAIEIKTETSETNCEPPSKRTLDNVEDDDDDSSNLSLERLESASGNEDEGTLDDSLTSMQDSNGAFKTTCVDSSVELGEQSAKTGKNLKRNKTHLPPGVKPLSLEALKDLRVSTWTLVKGGLLIGDKQKVFEWCARHRLIKNFWIGPCCGRLGSSYVSIWRCPLCHRRSSFLADSFFSKMQFSLEQAVFYLYLWAVETSTKQIIEEVSIEESTCLRMNRRIGDVCHRYLELCEPIGGLNADGEPSIVELDTTTLKKTSNKVTKNGEIDFGRVIGVVQRGESSNCFLALLDSFNSLNVNAFVEKHVRAHSIIITDASPEFQRIRDVPGKNFNHVVVDRKNRGFYDASDPASHLQTIKSLWSLVMQFFRNGQFGGQTKRLAEHVAEFVFRRRHPNTFAGLLYWISRFYPFDEDLMDSY